MSQALVSVVTPFHNTAAYLAQCIESVLAQTHSCFEYILVDNCSTDGAGEIAESYARRDPRIRLIKRPKILSQVQNYNTALAEICEASEYCKIVQADDFIFPECLQLMVGAFEQAKSIGLVSSYYLKGDTVRGSGFPYPTRHLPGREMAQLYFRTGLYVFGSPTAVCYRSSLVRGGQPFFDESLLHEDTEKCMQILQRWDFGFVHQVLSYLRLGNESISSAVSTFLPDSLDRYIIVRRYASAFLDADEADALSKKSRQEYYSVLANEAFKFRKRAFWQYHENGLRTLNETLDRQYLAWQIGRLMLWTGCNPGATAARVWRYAKRRMVGLRRSQEATRQ